MNQSNINASKFRVEAVPTENNPGIYSLNKITGQSKEFIGYATPLAILGKTPDYESNKLDAEHILLQKTIDKNGQKSLIYLIPIETENNALIGGVIFQKTRTEESEQVIFKGSVGIKRFLELKAKQISLDDAATVPFTPIEDVKPIQADTEIAIMFDHYAKPKPAKISLLSKILTTQHDLTK